ncbi:hypothetical protein SISSUDRAFT_1064858 [Sistotremastrum suecicum HHB10207 ss-3]|uniref:Uncharacterized protein n=1 Tax=Sistotremastrum suecicum HHB10207 ss-3 TaxID=1314776 RepID=A0A166A565_9AGAM|nr:hypothetical protein SISSUDRAFT_1064858 [Sistotremastrum suecicum HHB10207 ss-3]
MAEKRCRQKKDLAFAAVEAQVHQRGHGHGVKGQANILFIAADIMRAESAHASAHVIQTLQAQNQILQHRNEELAAQLDQIRATALGLFDLLHQMDFENGLAAPLEN